MHLFVFLISLICFAASDDATHTANNNQKLIIRGRVLFPGGPRTSIEAGAILSIELQDTSLADASAKVIAKGTSQVARFPIAFAIQYLPSQVIDGLTYSLSVTIRNAKKELLYINDVNIPIKTLGDNRTKFVDVPVIRVKNPSPPAINKRQWPELIGRNGEEAVRIIKSETGFSNVMTIQEGSPMTLDYRTDRVRVVVNDKGIVISVPSIG